MKRTLTVGLGALAVCLMAVGLGAPRVVQPLKGPGVVGDGGAFALDLYAELSKREGNLFFSPLGLRVGLSMTLAGARAETAEQMEVVLGLDGNTEAVHRAVGDLARRLDAGVGEDGSEVAIANSLWGQQGADFLPEFVAIERRCYGAGFGQVDFIGSPESARAIINEWVERRTDERISELLRPGDVNGSTELVLASAICFKGSWPEEFDPSNTQLRPFHRPAEAGGVGTIDVPTMYKRAEIGYYCDAEVSVVEIPYAGGDLSMVILLPVSRDGLADLEASLTPGMLERWLGALSTQHVGVFLPRFILTAQFVLNDTLSALGMPDAFDGSVADFSGMTGERGLWIDIVTHEATLDVNEQGTEAAGASAIMIQRGGAAFHANHPFLFLIRDRSSGTILFMGRLTDPSQTRVGRIDGR